MQVTDLQEVGLGERCGLSELQNVSIRPRECDQKRAWEQVGRKGPHSKTGLVWRARVTCL